jgi:ABC-type bacteriocin/lantibiotic exporter with double-glycine peptidase domain
VPRPFIAYLSVGHFVVVERFRAGRFEVFDPTSGAVRLEAPEDLYARGGGWVLSVTP